MTSLLKLQVSKWRWFKTKIKGLGKDAVITDEDLEKAKKAVFRDVVQSED